MRRGRLLLLISAAFLGVVVVALFVVYLGLPAIVKWVAIHQGRAQLGREVAIDDVRLDVWNGWYHLKGVRVAGRPGEPPLAEIGEATLRILYSFLFKGQLRASEVALTSPTLRLARIGPGELSISDILARFAPKEDTPASEKEPIEILADLIVISNGTILFEDRAVAPARTVEITNLTINLRDISTKLNTGRGTGTIAFLFNGTPAALTAQDIRVRPAHVKAQLNIVELDLNLVWPYLPPDLPLRPDWGLLSTQIALVFDAADGVRVDGNVTTSDFTVLRPGEDEAVVTLPELTVSARDLVYRDGTATAGRVEMATALTIVDESISPPQPYDIRNLRLVVENFTYPKGAPANLALTMDLPAGASLAVRGTAIAVPLDANLAVTLTGLDLALANPYIPTASPVTVAHGRVDATLTAAVTEGPKLKVNGDVTTSYVLLREGQAEPFVTHPDARTTISDLTWEAGAFALRRLAVRSRATIVDASVSPSQRFELTALEMVADDVTWPALRPLRMKSTIAVAGSGRGDIEGTFNPATLAADLRAKFVDLDVTRAGPYIPSGVPVAVNGGRLGFTLAFKHDRAAGITVNAEGAVAGLDVAHQGDPVIAVSDPRLAFTVADVRAQGSTMTMRRGTLTGAPRLADGSVSPPRRLDLRGLKAAVRDLAWPAKRPVSLELVLDLPVAGTLTVSGSADLDARAADLAIDLKNAALAAYQAFLPVDTPLGGEASAALTLAVRAGDTFTTAAKGQAALHTLTLGPPDQAVVRVEQLEVTGIDVQWPRAIAVDLVKIVKPYALLERDKDGTFPLRAMLTPRAEPGGPAPPAAAPAARPPSTSAAAERPLAISIREILLEGGTFRFVDRSTSPLYSEEISRLAVKVTNIDTAAPQERAGIALQAVVGATGALELKGEVAPAATPFYLDLEGELRQFTLPRANPYFRQVFDWFLKRGSVSNKIHYRIVGSDLTADNRIQIQRLGVEKDKSPIESDKKIGLPLGLIVAMITDSRGNIEFALPISGDLKQPGFSLGGAIWAALKNVLVNVVTGPFAAVGKLFGKGDEVEEFKMDPLTFAPGSANVSADGTQHLQRVADFLRASPNLRLDLRPVVSADDVASLKTGEITARIQQVQREEKLDDFPAAAAKLFAQTFPGEPVPDTPEKVVARLREQAPAPDGAVHELAARRLEAARQALVQGGGIEGGRLSSTAEGPPVAEGQGRVEFELTAGEG
jgi:hypothetical protein